MTTPAETDRRLGDLLRYGTVCEVSGTYCRVRIDDGFETDWLKMPPARAGKVRIWAPYSEGEEVSLACPDGDIAAATIHASHSTDEFAPPEDPTHTRIDWADGSWIGYDPGAGDMTAVVIGKFTLSAGLVILDSEVQVSGKVTATGEISSDQDVKAKSVSLLEHDHQETGAITKKPRR